MEILNYNSGSLSASVSGLTASTNYLIELNDLITGNEYSASATSNGSGTVVFTMPSNFKEYTVFLRFGVQIEETSAVARMQG